MHVEDVNQLLSLFCATNDSALRTYLGKAARRAVTLLTEDALEHTRKPGPKTYDRLSDIEKEECRNGRLIAAIKEYRARTNCGLRDSKQAVEWLAYGAGKPTFLGGEAEPMPKRFASDCPHFL